MKILKSAMRQFPEMTLSILNFLAKDNGVPEKTIGRAYQLAHENENAIDSLHD